MDYLILSVVSLLFPYIMNVSGVEHQTKIGVLGSVQSYNSHTPEFLYEEDLKKYKIIKTELVSYTGYGVQPDFFVEYSMRKGRLFFAPTFGFSPLLTGVQMKSTLITGSGTSTTQEVDYIKGVHLGAKLGITIKQANPYAAGFWDSLGVTPYVIASFNRVYYESSAYFSVNQIKKWAPEFAVGAEFQPKGLWTLYAQMNFFSFNTKGSNLTRQLNVKETQFQIGASYRLLSKIEKQNLNKDKSYDTVLQDITGKRIVDSETITDGKTKADSKNKNASNILKKNNEIKHANEDGSVKDNSQKDSDINLDFNF